MGETMSQRSATELKDAIANLQQILDSATKMVTQDGETVQFDLEQAASRLRDLQAELAVVQGKKTRRPLFNRIDLS